MPRSTAVVASRAARPGVPRVPPWAIPLVVFVPLAAWHDVLARQLPALLASTGARARLPLEALVDIGVASVVAGALVEAAVYGMLWGASGRRLPFWPTSLVALELSVIEPMAQRLMERIPPASPGAPMLALCVGSRAVWPGHLASDVTAAAFASFGAFALARCAGFAWIQARMVRRPVRDGLVLVVGTWLVSHVALAWGLRLMVGHGPLR